jgi:hypothetical protein
VYLVELLTLYSEKLFDIDHKMDDAHKLIQEELIRISNKCDRIEIKCEEVEAAARNPQVQYTQVPLPNIPLQALRAGLETRKNTPQIITSTRCPIYKLGLIQFSRLGII